MRSSIRIAAVLFGFLALTTAFAQNYPTRPIRVIVGYPAGGANDIIARAAGVRMSELLGQAIVVDNRGGGGGTIGADVVAKSPPDGYTLLMAAGAHALAPSLYLKLPYDIITDFAPISIVATGAYLCAVHPSLPVRSVKELNALAKARPGQLNFGSSGTGAPPHLSGELFNSMAGTKMTHVAYKGDAPALIDLIGGHIDLTFMTLSATAPYVISGKLRGLGVTGSRRSGMVPNLPTIAEAGLPGYEMTTWWGLLAPAKTPPDIVARLHDAVAKTVAENEFKSRLTAQGLDVESNTPEQFALFIKASKDKFSQLAKAAGVKPE
jgi:tripartite-type tricarboxylate transporter receptor subunit TctC